MTRPEIAILVSSFERPGHLRRVLASIAAQRRVQGAFEVVVTDDGSRDETPRLVRQFAASADFPVHFTTHPHAGFHIARCRNEGVSASTAPYLLFLDGDCIIPPDHVRAHLDRRRPGVAMAGYPIYLCRPASERITPAEIVKCRCEGHISPWQRMHMRWRHVRNEFYSLIRDPLRPKLLGGNLGIARADYQRVNGYDENFHGWGCEDDDLGLRLRASGIRVVSIAWWTNTYHLWHPKTPTAPTSWRTGANVQYLQRPLRLIRCLNGLTKRRFQDLRLRLIGDRADSSLARNLLPGWCCGALTSNPHDADIEIALATNGAAFSDHSACRVLVVPPGYAASRSLVARADLIFSDHQIPAANAGRTYPLHCFDAILQQQLGVRTPSRAALSRAPAAFNAALCPAA